MYCGVCICIYIYIKACIYKSCKRILVCNMLQLILDEKPAPKASDLRHARGRVGVREPAAPHRIGGGGGSRGAAGNVAAWFVFKIGFVDHYYCGIF